MFATPDMHSTLAALGSKCHDLIVGGRDAADFRLRELRREHPISWRRASPTALATTARDEMVGHMAEHIDELDGARCIQVDRVTVFVVGDHALLVKRHGPGDSVSNYRTRAAVARISAGQITLDTMETPTLLTVGYRWDSDLKQVGAAVISYRREFERPIWVAKAERSTSSQSVEWINAVPAAPEFDFASLTQHAEEDFGS